MSELRPTQLNIQSYTPDYIVRVNGTNTIHLGGDQLFWERGQRISSIKAAERLNKRVRKGAYHSVTIRKVKK